MRLRLLGLALVFGALTGCSSHGASVQPAIFTAPARPSPTATVTVPPVVAEAQQILPSIDSSSWVRWDGPEGTLSLRVPPGWEVVGQGSRAEGIPYTDSAKIFRFQAPQGSSNTGRSPVPGDIYVDFATVFRYPASSLLIDTASMARVARLELTHNSQPRTIDVYVWRGDLPFGAGLSFTTVVGKEDFRLTAASGVFLPADGNSVAQLLEVIRTAEFLGP